MIKTVFENGSDFTFDQCFEIVNILYTSKYLYHGDVLKIRKNRLFERINQTN